LSEDGTISGCEKMVFQYLKVGFHTIIYQAPSCSLLARYQELKIEIDQRIPNSSSKVIS
jgi:hypothetical protein